MMTGQINHKLIEEDFYIPELTETIYNALEVHSKNLGNPILLLDGKPGTGKTTTVRYFAKKHGYLYKEINSSLSLVASRGGLDGLYTSLITRASKFHGKTRFLFLDELDRIRVFLDKKTFILSRKDYEKLSIMSPSFVRAHVDSSMERRLMNGKNVQLEITFLEILAILTRLHAMKTRIIVVGATNEGWKLRKLIGDQVFNELFTLQRVYPPSNRDIRVHVQKFLVEKVGIPKRYVIFPRGLPRDLRKVKQWIVGTYLYGSTDNLLLDDRLNFDSFEKIKDFWSRHPRDRDSVPDVYPRLEKWIVYNVFTPSVVKPIYENQDEAFQTLKILALANKYNNPSILRGLPSTNIKYFKLKYPSS